MKKTDTRFFALRCMQFLLVAVAATSIAQPGIPPLTLSSTGSNQFRFADGYDNTGDIKRPWKYLVNSTDLQIGVGNLYTRLRFDIEEPNIGFNPADPVHREYLSRRTFGYDNGTFTIEAGHVMTQFGRGLSLSLKEDREVELYSVLDGVYGRLRLPWITLQGIAGRPLQWTSPLPASLITENGSRQDTLLLDKSDLWMRDMIAGAYTELFLPVEHFSLPLISAGSLGGGVVHYATDVGQQQLSFHDKKNPTEQFWHRNRSDRYIPSLTGTLCAGDAGISVEQAWMLGTTRRDTLDTVAQYAFESSASSPAGYATYLAATGRIFSVNILAEYKSYFYDLSKTSAEGIFSFLCPPQVRYLHSWHLLNKRLLSNLMNNVIGYNLTATWTPDERSEVIVNASYGGIHDSTGYFSINGKKNYWEGYVEWNSDIIENMVYCKAGLDWGQLDPDQQNITYRTFAAEALIGPLRKKHSLGITFESQLNSRKLFAEKDSAALLSLIRRIFPADRIAPFIDQAGTPDTDTIIKLFDPLISNSQRSPYTRFALCALGTFSYSCSPWFTIGITLEHETSLETMQTTHHIISNLTVPQKTYASCSLRITPHPCHTVTIEYGSMSGGKKCTLGTCVDLPPFEGLKVEVTSIL